MWRREGWNKRECVAGTTVPRRRFEGHAVREGSRTGMNRSGEARGGAVQSCACVVPIKWKNMYCVLVNYISLLNVQLIPMCAKSSARLAVLLICPAAWRDDPAAEKNGVARRCRTGNWNSRGASCRRQRQASHGWKSAARVLLRQRINAAVRPRALPDAGAKAARAFLRSHLLKSNTPLLACPEGRQHLECHVLMENWSLD
jgi:hypothetical protein